MILFGAIGMYALDIKRCARQLVKESFNDSTCGHFSIPSEREVIDCLQEIHRFPSRLARRHGHPCG